MLSPALLSRPVPMRAEILPQKPGQLELVERLLSGSQAKTAYAIRVNAERMIKECPGGLASIGFLTISAGDYKLGKFWPLLNSAEASRRFNNLARRVLKRLFSQCIAVTERTKKGGIHFHLLGVIAGCPDIRTGIDFAAFSRRDYQSAPHRLRVLWRWLRMTLPKYGFGARVELLPVRKTGEAVASYVSKYIEKNVCNRLKEDAHKKLVRYLGWLSRHLKPNQFAWASRRAIAWRWKARTFAELAGIEEPEQAAAALGPRWAWKLTWLWRQCLGDDLFNGFLWTWPEKEACRATLINQCRDYALERLNKRLSQAVNLGIGQFRRAIEPQKELVLSDN